jgi:hypothetical protein
MPAHPPVSADVTWGKINRGTKKGECTQSEGERLREIEVSRGKIKAKQQKFRQKGM